MGRIADRLKAQLNEMAARHAETDREIDQLKREATAARARLDAAHAALMAELTD